MFTKFVVLIEAEDMQFTSFLYFPYQIVIKIKGTKANTESEEKSNYMHTHKHTLKCKLPLFFD